MDKHIGHAEVWEMLLMMIWNSSSLLIERLERTSRRMDAEWWSKPIYALVFLRQEYSSITAAINESEHSEEVIRSWLTKSYDQTYARMFVEWLDREGYAMNLINIMGFARWPWLNHYFTLTSWTDTEALKSFVIKGRKEERGASQQPITGRDKTILGLKETPIEYLGLSTRAYNCLRNINVQSVYELTMMTTEDLRNIRNFGPKSLIEVVEELEQYGLSIDWGPSDYAWRAYYRKKARARMSRQR